MLRPWGRWERVRFRVTTTGNIHPGVVNAAHGWWFPENPAPEHGVFESDIDVILTDDPPRDEPWKMRSSMVADPEGNLLEIASDFWE
jgi:anaerobic selenocysteine-containing dehydrogenase